MIIKVDLAEVPPGVSLLEPDDFGNFKVLVATPSRTFVTPRTLHELAGSHASESWIRKVDEMCQYAEGRGWVRDDGALQAHIVLDAELASAGGESS